MIRRVAWGTALMLALIAAAAARADAARDQRIETMLLEGKVLSSTPIGNGITRPDRVELEWNGERITAAFKKVAMDMSGRRTQVRHDTSLSFTDDYHYERAAYLLDRQLGIGMVPVVVLRRIEREEGALIEWVDGAISEAKRRTESLQVHDPVSLFRQRDVMRVFDLLILNEDRNQNNQLITTDDWKLHLIDHSRSFRLDKKLPDRVEGIPYPMPRWLYENLEALELDELKELLGGLMTKSRIKAILTRRDLILEKTEHDRQEFGDEIIFHAE